MKSLLKGTILTLFFTQICIAQWLWQNPLPQGNDLNSVYFINRDTGWAVGDYGTILKTTNAGFDWVVYQENTYSNLNSVFFMDENTGWIAGGYPNTKSLILKTTDGGTN